MNSILLINIQKVRGSIRAAAPGIPMVIGCFQNHHPDYGTHMGQL